MLLFMDDFPKKQVAITITILVADRNNTRDFIRSQRPE